MKLSSQTPAVVTGGASGLGAAVARHLAVQGAPVAILDRDLERGEALADELGGAFAAVDVADPHTVAAGVAAARGGQGQERILVNCAGIAPAAKTVSRGEPHDAGLFARVVNINLLGSFYCAAIAAAGMANLEPQGEGGGEGEGERGIIVHTASVAAFDGQLGQVAYAASKAGVAGMVLPMARDLAPKAIRVVAIAPGVFDTPMVQGLSPEVRQSLGGQVPFPSRLGRPEEFAQLVAHVVANPFLNGEVIRLDGAIRMAAR
ncbi:MAG: SDR family NAD(P)-dependent oxidoreductase [Candidatus Competibacterales bacterium]